MGNLFLKKLQVKANHTVKIVHAPKNIADIFIDNPLDISIKYNDIAVFDVIITFSISKTQLYAQIESNLKYIDAKTVFWIFYPKKSSKIPSDLDFMKSWEELAKYGLSPCASVAVNDIWTALRLKFISEIKPSGLRNDHIKINIYADYIDVGTKTVKLPEDFLKVLQNHPKALNYFNSLAYSHKKEYVLWILTAKQEKTRLNRIEKALNMLLNDKKNPLVK